MYSQVLKGWWLSCWIQLVTACIHVLVIFLSENIIIHWIEIYGFCWSAQEIRILLRNQYETLTCLTQNCKAYTFSEIWRCFFILYFLEGFPWIDGDWVWRKRNFWIVWIYRKKNNLQRKTMYTTTVKQFVIQLNTGQLHFFFYEKAQGIGLGEDWAVSRIDSDLLMSDKIPFIQLSPSVSLDLIPFNSILDLAPYK